MKNHYEVRGDVTVIFIESKKHGLKETVIDTHDLEKVMSFPNTWRVKHDKINNRFYIQGNMTVEKNKIISISLHRWLMDSPKGFEVDHYNNNSLDNRRLLNLRIATKTENAQNREGSQVNSKSGIRGVSWSKAASKWVVQAKVSGKNRYFGIYSDISEAARVSEEVRSELMPFSKEGALSGGN